MKKYLFLTAIVLFIIIIYAKVAYNAGENNIAVLNLTPEKGVDVSEAKMITLMLESKLLETGKYVVIER